MRIVHIADRLTDRGGAYWHSIGILDGLRGEHDVRLLVGRDEGVVSPPCPVIEIAGLDAPERAPAALDDVVGPLAPDLLHVHNIMNPAILRWARERGACLFSVQDHRVFCPGRGKWTKEGQVCRRPMSVAVCRACFSDDRYFSRILSLTRERLEAIDGMPVVVLSQYMKDELLALGFADHDISVIPPFVHGLDRSNEPSGSPCVLFVGRLVEAKGVWDAVEAWRRSGVALPLVFAGTGKLRTDLERAGFEVEGWVSRDRLSALYRRARAVLLPPRWQEPFGIVGLEALAMGVPVVAWQSGGTGEWHTREPLIAWGDVEGLARRLTVAVEKRALLPPGFESAVLMDRLVALYRTVAGG